MRRAPPRRRSRRARTATSGSPRTARTRSAMIKPDGTLVTEFTLPAGSSSPAGITAGPDGNLWFTETGTNKIGEIDRRLTLHRVHAPRRHSPYGITTGPDGNLWFTEFGTSKIGHVPDRRLAHPRGHAPRRQRAGRHHDGPGRQPLVHRFHVAARSATSRPPARSSPRSHSRPAASPRASSPARTTTSGSPSSAPARSATSRPPARSSPRSRCRPAADRGSSRPHPTATSTSPRARAARSPRSPRQAPNEQATGVAATAPRGITVGSQRQRLLRRPGGEQDWSGHHRRFRERGSTRPATRASPVRTSSPTTTRPPSRARRRVEPSSSSSPRA